MVEEGFKGFGFRGFKGLGVEDLALRHWVQ